MKKLTITWLLVAIAFISVAQLKRYTIEATEWVKTDTLFIGNDTIVIGAMVNGQFLRKVDGIITNVDLTGTGTDSLLFDGSVDNWALKDYRGGSVYRSTPIVYEDFYLLPGADRQIRIDDAAYPDDGTDLIIMAGADHDGIGGGDLYLRGGGTFGRGNVQIGDENSDGSEVSIVDSVNMNGKKIVGLPVATTATEPVRFSQLAGLTQTVYSIALPYATTVTGRVAGATEGVDYETGWVLAAGTSAIDLQITHGMGRRVANVNVCTVSGTAEQMLRPFAGAYSGWQTPSTNVLLINGLATTPLALKIYIIFE